MVQSTGNIPHALAVAHSDLIAELAKGIRQYNADLQYSNSHAVLRCIERFVDALSLGGRDELRRRATLVETLCGPGSDYETARTQSLRSYRGQPRGRKGPILALSRLRKSGSVPRFLVEVAQERQDIERVLNERISNLNLSAAARKAYETWRSICRTVQREVEPLEVDGCWYLFHSHEAGEDNPSDRAECAKAIIQTDMDGANLESINAAVEALLDWARNHSGGKANHRAKELQQVEILNASDEPKWSEADSLDRLAKRYNVSPRTLRRRIDVGLIGAKKINRKRWQLDENTTGNI